MTSSNKDTVSVVTSHFSKYMIVDKNVWRDAWAEEISYEAEDGIDTYYTVLTIDCSGSMNSNDPIIYNNNISSLYDATYNRITCNRIKGALDFVNCMTENDRVAVVLFDDYAFYTLDFTDDKEAIKLALQKVCNDDGTNYSNAINKSISLFSQDVIDSSNICTRIVFLSDGEGRCDSKYITMADAKDIIIHGIGLGNDFNDYYLKEMSAGTEGSYYRADSSEMLSVLYEKIYLYDQFDKSDDDNDGLYDIFETAGIRLINGQVIYTRPDDNDTDDDGLLDGEEIIPEVKKLDVDSAFLEDFVGNNWYYLPMESDPNLVDSDNDNASDKDDYTPLVCNEWRSYLFYPFNEQDILQREADIRWKIMTNEEDKTVQKMPTTDMLDFQDRWAAMGMIGDKIAYQIDEVHLIYHGYPRSICIATDGWLYADKNQDGLQYHSCYNAQTNDMIIDDLEEKTIYYLNLSSCNSGNIDFNSNKGKYGFENNMAISFLGSKHEIDTITAWDGTTSYFGLYVDVLHVVNVYFSFEKVGRGSYFDGWSAAANNGYVRKPKGRLTYFKDETGQICYK